MALNKNKDLKLFYSISEVAEMLGVSETLLRFWEKEFPNIHPTKAGRGIRQYTKDDIDQVRQVYHLVKEQGMTLEGARRSLRHGTAGRSTKIEVIDRLKGIRDELQSINRELGYLE